MNLINLEHSVLTLTDDDILIVDCHDNHIFELEEIKQIVKASGELTKGRKVPTLTIPGEFSDATKEALEFIFSPAATEFTSCDAYLVKTLAHKIIGNFYLKLKKPNVPTRLFHSKNAAMSWLIKSKTPYIPS